MMQTSFLPAAAPSLPDHTETLRQFNELRPWGGFNIIRVDPPWRFDTWSDKGHAKSPQAQYDCHSADWIKALPIEALSADHAILWLWAVSPLLPLALECVASWGFTFKTMGWWSKKTTTGKQAFGTGYILGWHAAIEAADRALNDCPDYHWGGWCQGQIRALLPPGDRRAALAALVKPLVWEDVPEICTRQKASALGGHYSVVEFDAGTDDAHYATNFDLGGLLSFVFILEPDPLGGRRPKRFPTPEAARAAAETDYRHRVVASIMGDEG